MDQPITPTPPVFTHKKSYIWLIVAVIAFLLTGSSVLAYKYWQLKNQLNQSLSMSVKKNQCQECSGIWDDSCPGNHSCFVPTGLSQGVCVPVPKMGQKYTIDQINQECGTNFPKDPAADWKTVTDKNNGYMLKIPQGWESYPGRMGTDRFVRRLKTWPVIIDGQEKHIQTSMIIEKCFPPNCVVDMVKNPINRVVLPIQTESITIAGFPAKKEVFVSEDSPWPSKQSFRLVIEKGQGVYLISWQDFSEIFDQILSTFKFTDTPSSQQVLSIQLTKCCSCPAMINTSQIGTDGWVAYEQGKDYTAQRPKACSAPNIGACAPCPLLETGSNLDCKYNGKTYQDGETFPGKCNSCTCDNAKIACTLMACQ